MVHLTPAVLASVLARYAPKQIDSLLDPAVGRGSLLLPFARRKRLPRRVTCVDSDGSVAKHFPLDVAKMLGSRLNFVRSDFLQWADEQLAGCVTFDCIVVNPPFCGKQRRQIDLSHILCHVGKPQTRTAPIELAFLAKCIGLLAPSGRLLAVLPSSAITSVNTQWFREFMLKCGSITRVHEIPPNSFSGVEGRIYLLVFDKDRRNRGIVLCNSDLIRPSKILMRVSDLADNLRFDYSFHKAAVGQRASVASAFSRKNRIKWLPVGQLADIRRGNVEAPFEVNVLHTTHRDGPFWTSNSRQGRPDASRVTAVPGDVLIARVGRGCANSVGIYCGNERMTVSDCILVLRPKDARPKAALLLALRVLLKVPGISALLERGTGASYITLKSLSLLKVPSNLHLSFPQHFKSYARAIQARRTRAMLKIELVVAKAIRILKG